LTHELSGYTPKAVERKTATGVSVEARRTAVRLMGTSWLI